MVFGSCNGGWANITIAMTTASPVTLGYDSSEPHSVTEYRTQFAQAAQWSALYSLLFYQQEHFSECCQVMLTVTAQHG